jgi:MFS transporter, ACS family, hexuronate transporter
VPNLAFDRFGQAKTSYWLHTDLRLGETCDDPATGRSGRMNAATAPNYNRWLLFVLLTFAGILNLADRQIIAVLKPEMSAEMGWSDADYGALAAWFQGATAFGLLFTGAIVDKIGVKWANPVGVMSWSLAAMGHALAHTMPQFILCRIGLGATEAMGTPTMIKTIATILPPAVRSTGFGIVNAVNSFGAISAPLAIPFLALAYGWRGTFIALGIAGVVWTAVWLITTRKSRFEADPLPVTADHAPRPPILRDRSTYAIAGAKVLSDATWWLLLFWMPDFFNRQFGLSGVALGPPLALAYTGAAIGALGSGTLATWLLGRGLSVNTVRKGTMLASGILVLVLPTALLAPSPWVAAAVLGLVLAAHQGFSTTLFALITDVTPTEKVGRMTSLAAFCGNIGGMGIVWAAGKTLTLGLGYAPLFVFAGSSYLLALAWIQLWLPRIVSLGAPSAEPSIRH